MENNCPVHLDRVELFSAYNRRTVGNGWFAARRASNRAPRCGCQWIKRYGMCKRYRTALCRPPRTVRLQLEPKFCNRALFDLGDAAFVNVQFGGDLAAQPAEVVKQSDYSILSRREASASLSDFGAKRERGLGRGCQAPHRDLIKADRRGRNSVARGAEGWRGCAYTPSFSSGERVFIAEEILHRSPDSMLRVGSELQSASLIEAVHGVNQSDHAGTGQIIECDARRYPALEASRDSVHQLEVLKDCSVSGCAVVRNSFGVVAEFHFRSFSARLVRGNKQRADLLPKTPRAEGDHPLAAAIGERSVSGGLHETERSAVRKPGDTRAEAGGRR